MSEPHDSRHARRQQIMQALFTLTFHDHDPVRRAEFLTEHSELNDIVAMLPELDAKIQAVAQERPLAEIKTIDLSVLRLIVFESLTSKTPAKVLIDEAVELAKEFGTENSSKFVNGVLAKILELK